MTTVALRVSMLLAILVCTIGAPARAGSSAPPFVVEVYARDESVNARITVPNQRDETAFVPTSKRHEFEFPLGVTKYTFSISGCGKVQTKTLTVPVGHGGTLITVYRGCSLFITGR